MARNRLIAVSVALMLVVPGVSSAQTLRSQHDPVWDSVLIGMAAGGALGLYQGLKEVDEPGPCMGAGCAPSLALLGGAIALGIDKLISRNRPLQPGSLIDDSRKNGRLIGMVGLTAVGIVMNARQKDCEGSPCNLSMKLISTGAMAALGAGIGAVIDAAIPSHAQSVAARAPAQRGAHRPFSFNLGFRF
jgi:hypothetical protein